MEEVDAQGPRKINLNKSDTSSEEFADKETKGLQIMRNDSVNLEIIHQAADCKETIKLSYDRKSAQAQKDLSKKSYASTKLMQMSFNKLILQYSNPAALFCQVNPMSSKNKELTQFEILQFTMPFFEILPWIQPESDNKFRSMSYTSKRSLFAKKLTIEQELLALKENSGLESRILDKKVINQLQAKIFSPHLISNNTLLSFQLVSMIDVFRVFYQDNKQHAKFYFKFDPEENEEPINPDKIQELPPMKRSHSSIAP